MVTKRQQLYGLLHDVPNPLPEPMLSHRYEMPKELTSMVILGNALHDDNKNIYENGISKGYWKSPGISELNQEMAWWTPHAINTKMRWCELVVRDQLSFIVNSPLHPFILMISQIIFQYSCLSCYRILACVTRDALAAQSNLAAAHLAFQYHHSTRHVTCLVIFI